MGILIFALCGMAVLLRGAMILRLTRLFAPNAVMALISRQRPVLARNLFFLAGMFAGLKVDFERFKGPALPTPFLIVSNHQSLADIPALAAAFPRHVIRYVAKKSLGRHVPYVSVSLRCGRDALISRTSDYRSSHQKLERFATLAGQGLCLAVFPEGTRSRTGEVQHFYTGAARIILERAPIPVLSVAVDGGYRISTIGNILTKMKGTRYRLKPLTLYAAPKGKKEILTVLARAEAEISEQILSWRGKQAAGQKKPIHEGWVESRTG